ncbi:MAG: hypothetical protein ABEI52_05465, partial [Halobacteriaceae archaeon]
NRFELARSGLSFEAAVYAGYGTAAYVSDNYINATVGVKTGLGLSSVVVTDNTIHAKRGIVNDAEIALVTAIGNDINAPVGIINGEYAITYALFNDLETTEVAISNQGFEPGQAFAPYNWYGSARGVAAAATTNVGPVFSDPFLTSPP